MFFPVQGSPEFQNVVLQLPMDGAHNSTSFPDKSLTTKTTTRAGGTIISTALGFPAAWFPLYGTLAVTSHADFAIGTGDYTLSFRCYLSSLAASYYFIDFRPPSTNGFYPGVRGDSSGKLYFFWNNTDRISSNAGVLTAGADHHIAVCRSGSSTRMFLSGVQVGSTYSDSSSIPQSRILIGGHGYLNIGDYTGYLWDIRYVRSALYTENFTPPASKSLIGYGSNKVFYQNPRTQPSFLQAARLGL